MGLLDGLLGSGSKDRVRQDLMAIKAKFEGLAGQYPRQGDVVRFGSLPQALKVIPGVCNDAIRALEQGLDVNDRPINKSQIADGLKRLVSDARQDAGLVATVLNPDGVRLYGQYLDELERIAGRI